MKGYIHRITNKVTGLAEYPVTVTSAVFRPNGVNLDKYINESKSTFSDKNLLVFGDSITHGNMWQPYFSKYVDFANIYTYAADGIYWQCGNNSRNWNVFTQLLTPILTAKVGGIWDTQIHAILIYVGINDIWELSTVQTQAEMDTELNAAFSGYSNFSAITDPYGNVTSEAQSIKFTLEKLYDAFPNALIVLCTPTICYQQISNSALPVNANYKDLANNTAYKIRRIAKEFGFNMIDLNAKAGINYYNVLTKTRDGLHPNALGGNQVGLTIARELRNLMIGNPSDYL